MPPGEIVNRLREHSGLPVSSQQLQGSAFVDNVQAIKRSGTESGLEASVTDIIECLQGLNRVIQSASEDRNKVINQEVVYAVSGIMLLAIELSVAQAKAGKNCSSLLTAAWRIACAWDALLAGDIDDIHQHLMYESSARNLG